MENQLKSHEQENWFLRGYESPEHEEIDRLINDFVHKSHHYDSFPNDREAEDAMEKAEELLDRRLREVCKALAACKVQLCFEHDTWTDADKQCENQKEKK